MTSKKHVFKSFHSENALVKYAADHCSKLHPSIAKLYEETLKLPMGFMAATPELVSLNCNLIRTVKAKKVLEVGVFTGIHAMAAALELPFDGIVVACEINDDYIKTGRPYWKEAGVEDRISVIIQPAVQTLDTLIADGQTNTFDFAFIDADKANYDLYYERCLELVRPGGIISIDNVLWSGRVTQEADSPATAALQALNDKMKTDERVNVTLLTIGDGVALVFKK